MGPYFQVSPLESILVWLQEETARVEKEVAKLKSLDALLKCFVSAKAGSFENLLGPFLKICRHSTPIAIGIAIAQFFRRVTEKLNLLRILCAARVCLVHPNRALLVERYGIHETVAALRRKDDAQALPQGSRYAQELDRAEETHDVPHGQRYVGHRHAVAAAGHWPDE
ncbi:hypothetical protein H4582DRAFT_2103411 [Lactarius indigo]|nr:hypothetical protein H4582DRAFT_2103411 [Lactarius indigo]